MSTTVATYIASFLKSNGIEKFFLLTGGDQALWIALAEHGIDQVLLRSEASAAYAADGYAQRAGVPAVAYGQAGPGAANLAAALADPYWSRTPLLAITGGTPAGVRGRHEYQELPAERMMESVTAASFVIDDPNRIADILPRALAIARRYGPVNVTVPKNLFASEIRDGSAPEAIPFAKAAGAPPAEQVAEAAGAVARMRRPLVLAGTGAKRARIGPAVQRLAELLGAPIATSPGGKGVVSEGHDHVIGPIGRYASTYANEVAAQADGAIVLGSRLGGMVTDGYRLLGAGVPVVHIDHDDASLAAHPGEGVRLHGDLRDGLDALLSALADKAPGESDWAGSFVEDKREWASRLRSLPAAGEGGAIRPHALFPTMNERASEITLVADTGYMAAWASSLFRADGPESFLRANGSLGWALPAALGAQLGSDGRRVVCLTGDGGFGYHSGDLETAVRRDLPVVVVVLNNRSLAFEYHEQKYRWDGQVVPIVNDLSDLDHAAVARAYGWRGERVDTVDGFADAFARALADPSRAWLLDVVVDKEAHAPITNYDKVLERVI